MNAVNDNDFHIQLITLDNVKKIGERIACKALKTVLSHSYNNRINQMIM